MLTAQMAAERERFYPAVLHLAQTEVLDAYESQAPVERALRRVLVARVTGKAFKSRVGILKALVEKWAKAEERSLFPTLEHKLSEQRLEAIGAQIESHFLTVLKRLWQDDCRHPLRKRALSELTRIARSRSASRLDELHRVA